VLPGIVHEVATEAEQETITVTLPMEQARLLKAQAGYDGITVEESLRDLVRASNDGFSDFLRSLGEG